MENPRGDIWEDENWIISLDIKELALDVAE